MQNLSVLINERRDREKKFLVDGKRTIAKENIRALSFISCAAVLLSIASVLLTYLLKIREVSSAQIVMIPVMVLFALGSTFYYTKGKANPKIVWLMCISFEVVVFAFMVFIDVIHGVVGTDETLYGLAPVDGKVAYPAIYMPLVLTALAAGIFFSTKTSCLINISATAVFITLDLFYKVEEEWAWIRNYDICVMILGLAFATVVSAHCRDSKILEFTTKMKYKSLSMRDPLLENVYNKRGYEDAIDNYLVSNNPNVNCAFIVLDLNDFKHINDNYGHDMGDQILRCMADTLVSLFRDSDIIGRFGGDEFIVLADGLSDADAVEKKCHYIAELIGKRAQETGAIKVFSSLGAVICDKQRVDFDQLFELADQAMYEAKEMGRKADRFVLRHYVAPDNND